mmetsp:Transcript_10397/g.12059  ORF Transcript_10397/g.12059 Transcript_10397/m.12059 type:complete len:233 (-) Transcript_10397:21-719(-)
MNPFLCSLLLLFSLHSLASSQEYAQDYNNYQDYADGYAQEDNLYTSYASKQQQKQGGGGTAVGKSGGGGGATGFLKSFAVGGAGWYIGGRIHAQRLKLKLKRDHMKSQKTLYSQYYNDVYKLQQQNAELAYVVEQYQEAIKQIQTDVENEQLQRDWEEFKQPDIDGDDSISRAEFNMYVKNYLSNYPGMTEQDYPKFDEFDHDGDGHISFQEYAQQMALVVQQAEREKASKV